MRATTQFYEYVIRGVNLLLENRSQEEDPRPDEKPATEEGSLADTSKVKNVSQFLICPTLGSDQTAKLDINDLLNKANPPQIILYDLIVLDLGNAIWTEIINCKAICHQKNIPPDGPCCGSDIIFNQIQELFQNRFGGLTDTINEAKIFLD